MTYLPFPNQIRYIVSIARSYTLMHTHNHEHCIQSALAQAEKRCSEKGARFTPIRRKVLQLIWESHQAAKAYDLLDRIKSFDQGATPMTIYRALQFLQEHGFIHRVETLNAYVGCSHMEYQHQHELMLLICESCQQIEERPAPSVIEIMREEIALSGFSAKRSTIEIYGMCQTCASHSPPSH